MVIATTNKLNDLDKSLRRGGRLDIDIRFDMPEAEDRFLIFKEHLARVSRSVKIDDEALLGIAKAASGFVSSEHA